MSKTTHIVVITIPVFTHQISMVELCKKLVHLHPHIHVTCIFPTIGPPPPSTITFLESLPSTINYTFLPQVNKEDLPQGLSPALQVQIAVSQSMPSFRDALKSLYSTTPVVALVADPFANEALEIAKELNLLSYIYVTTSAMTLSLLLHLPVLHEEISCEYRVISKAILIPGCVPIHGRDLPCEFQDRSSLAYKVLLERSKRFSLCDGFMVNSFFELEEGIVKALQEQSSSTNRPVLLVGPIMQIGTSSLSNGIECVKWLDDQRPNSILYVSFGSVCSLSQEQMDELALGLELSKQKFLWVLRAPSDSTYGTHPVAANENPLQYLPHGFLERTKRQGLVVPFWAPQTKILSHTSTGGFLTHCGWNSTLESTALGVPMIAWPLVAEQKMNATWITEGLKVALRPKVNKNGLVGREEVAKLINDLLLSEEGNGIRQRIEKLKDAVADALKEDGSSTRALLQFGSQLENSLR